MTKRDYINRVEMYQNLISQLTSTNNKIADSSLIKVRQLLINKVVWYKEILKNWNTQTGTHAGYYGTTGITTSSTGGFISSKSN